MQNGRNFPAVLSCVYPPSQKRKPLAVPAIKQYFTSYQCKVLLYLFNNELIIEKKKNYAIIKS
jgi:hypothetical protein